MKRLRDWATPLVFGVFVLMAITGIAMFFHKNNHLQEEVHAWAGWAMVAFVVGHVVANLGGFKKHFTGKIAPAALVVSLLVLGGTLVISADDEGEGKSLPQIAVGALTDAPLSQVAPLFHKSPDEALAALKAVGVALPDVNASIGSVAKEREQVSAAITALSN
jgi:hypothetical protein